MHFDLNNRCDLCDKALLVSDPVRTRCDQCVRFGAPAAVSPKIREIGGGGLEPVPCPGCGRDRCQDGTTVLPLVEGRCLSCRIEAAHPAG